MRWNDAMTLDFVKMYLKHACLWKPSDPDYKKKAPRNEAYKQLAIDSKEKGLLSKEMNTNDVKNKIKSLRTTYCQMLNKIYNNSTDPDNIYEPRLPWFHEMDKYLKDVVTTRASTHIERVAASSWNEDTNLEDAESNHSSNDPLSQEDVIDNYLQFNNEIPKKRFSSPSSTSKKKIKRDTKSPEAEFLELSKEVIDDEFELYGRYIAHQLRKLSTRKALKLQMDIQALITDARLSEA